MARAKSKESRGAGIYGLVELFYGIRITDELLKRRGLKKTREEYVRSAFYRSVASGIIYAAIIDFALYQAASPPILLAILTPIVWFEGFSLYAVLDAFKFFLPFRRLPRSFPARRVIRARQEIARRRKLEERAPRRPRPHPAALARTLLGSYARKLTVVFNPEDMKKLIEAADVGIPVEYYYSLMLAAAIVTAITAAVVSFLAVYFLFGLPLWSALLIAPLGFIVGFASGLMAAFAYLSFKADSRKRKLEQDLTTWIAAMMAYMSSGVPLAEALRRSASALRPGPLRREVDRTIRDMELMGVDVRGALAAMASRVPSLLVREVVSGLIDAIDSGENLQEYFKEIFNYVLNVRRAYMKKLIGDLTFAAELFVMLFVVTPLFMAIILALLGSASTGGLAAQLSYEQLLAVLSYLFIPLVGAGYMILVDSIYPRWW